MKLVIYSDALKHHGILGQKWGVRRYQKKDGTLTAAGKKRLAEETKLFPKTKTSKENRIKAFVEVSILETKEKRSSFEKAIKKDPSILNDKELSPFWKWERDVQTYGEYAERQFRLGSMFAAKYAEATLKDLGWEINKKTLEEASQFVKRNRTGLWWS